FLFFFAFTVFTFGGLIGGGFVVRGSSGFTPGCVFGSPACSWKILWARFVFFSLSAGSFSHSSIVPNTWPIAPMRPIGHFRNNYREMPFTLYST
ncbi:MAG: hypothetical protein MJ106_01095, partial [Lentisphaeria bacterium]|nr:hypothetical protein [Lentisphaeria bacterium]